MTQRGEGGMMDDIFLIPMNETVEQTFERGYAQALSDAVTAVGNLKIIKSWESDGEKITDCYISIDEHTKAAAIAAITALEEK